LCDNGNDDVVRAEKALSGGKPRKARKEIERKREEERERERRG
jgi:hypothetical protein